jgi:ABC-type amino acid transport substrate-binding protein
MGIDGMIKYIRYFILATLMLWSQALWADTSLPPDIAAIQQRGTLRLAVYQIPIPPMTIKDSKGHWSGIEIDIAQMIANQLSVKLVVIPTSTYDNIVNLVANNKADLGAEVYVTPERALKINFSHPYYSFHPHLLVNRLQATKYNWNTQAQVIQNLQQKTPVTIGVVLGGATVQVIQENFPNMKIVGYNTDTQAFQDVVDGKIFAAVGATSMSVQQFLSQNPRDALVAEDIILPQATILVSIAISWENFHLRELIDSYFEYLQKNGVLTSVFQKYGVTP